MLVHVLYYTMGYIDKVFISLSCIELVTEMNAGMQIAMKTVLHIIPRCIVPSNFYRQNTTKYMYKPINVFDISSAGTYIGHVPGPIQTHFWGQHYFLRWPQRQQYATRYYIKLMTELFYNKSILIDITGTRKSGDNYVNLKIR